MSTKTFFLVSAMSILSIQGAFAFQPKETAQYFNGPKVMQVSNTSAVVSLSTSVLQGLTDEEKQGVYFQYYETNLMCIAIYPTPEYCLPKKTEVGKTEVSITNLKSNTSYTILYKRDNTIRCITTPCPGNEFESRSVEFTTKSSGEVIKDTPSGNKKITSNLRFKSWGEQVTSLQIILIQKGYLTGNATGYFGVLTLKAVKDFQRANNITPTGFVGPLTRAVLINSQINIPVSVGEEFQGTITAYSTACFADGECSITVDGKKVITTIGWSQQIVGKVTGIQDFGSIENNIGAHAKVYAKKIDGGYTLYGSSSYYIEITQQQSKLPTTSSSTISKLVEGITWVWQQTDMGDSILLPNNKGAFTVYFGTDGTISGTTDCNSFFGTVTFTNKGVVTFGPLGSSKMYCGGSQENVFLRSLAKVGRFNIDSSGNLMLHFSDTTGMMHFIKK